jgi:hypothetical protein
MLKKFYPTLLLMVLPLIAGADSLMRTQNLFVQVRDMIRGILIPLVFSLALLLFFYGVAKYIWSEGQGKEDGKKFMIWGVVALFVMASVWGIVAFINDELGLGGQTNVPIPTIGQ